VFDRTPLTSAVEQAAALWLLSSPLQTRLPRFVGSATHFCRSAHATAA
jgi:hypothetical protein